MSAPTERGDGPAGHTPGPWISEPTVDAEGISVIASFEADFISNPTRGQVCHISVVVGASGDDPEVAKANARLIAAAPDYDAAARKMVDALGYAPDEVIAGAFGDDVLEALNALRAAIARAEGKPTDAAGEAK